MQSLLYFLLLVLVIGLSQFNLTIEKFSDYVSKKSCKATSRTYLTSVEPDTIFGSGTAIKSIDSDDTLTIKVEANLPLADGGNFNNESVIYQVYSQSEKPLMVLEWHNDGFYRGEIALADSSNFNEITKILIVGEKDSQKIPILEGEFDTKYLINPA